MKRSTDRCLEDDIGCNQFVAGCTWSQGNDLKDKESQRYPDIFGTNKLAAIVLPTNVQELAVFLSGLFMETLLTRYFATFIYNLSIFLPIRLTIQML